MQLRAITVGRARNSSFCAGFPCSEDDNRRCFLGKLTGDYYLWCYCKCFIFGYFNDTTYTHYIIDTLDF